MVWEKYNWSEVKFFFILCMRKEQNKLYDTCHLMWKNIFKKASNNNLWRNRKQNENVEQQSMND